MKCVKCAIKFKRPSMQVGVLEYRKVVKITETWLGRLLKVTVPHVKPLVEDLKWLKGNGNKCRLPQMKCFIEKMKSGEIPSRHFSRIQEPHEGRKKTKRSEIAFSPGHISSILARAERCHLSVDSSEMAARRMANEGEKWETNKKWMRIRRK